MVQVVDDGSCFTVGSDGVYVAEISQLSRMPNMGGWSLRAGFKIGDHVFSFDRPDVNFGEVTGWLYKSTGGLSALVIND